MHIKKQYFLIIVLIGFATITLAQKKSNDEFNGFWKIFKSALTKNNKETITKLTQFPVNYTNIIDKKLIDTTIDKKMFIKVYNKFFDKKTINLLIKEKPTMVQEDYYVIYIGEYLHYSFDKTKDGWRFIGIVGND